jgi:hypothetical protein
MVEVERAARVVLAECRAGTVPDDVKIFFREDPSSPKGGELLAFAVSSEVSYSDFRRTWVRRYRDLPCPHRLWCVSGWIFDSAGGMGKVTLAGLLRQVGAPDGV